eukprot:11220051-Lingulodinium_polyedra.AAC.1
MATFADGTAAAITDITSAELRDRRLPRQGSKKNNPHSFEIEHQASHHRLRGFAKKDRDQLFILQEQTKQLLQININHCKDEAHPSEIMRGIAEQYVSGEIDRGSLKEKRNEIMKVIRKERNNRKSNTMSKEESLKKRPASSVASSSLPSPKTPPKRTPPEQHACEADFLAAPQPD